MTLQELKDQHTALQIARAQMKDQVEGMERQLMTLAFTIQTIEENEKKDAEARANRPDASDA